MDDASTGKVVQVGAGPGAPDLLTFHAARATAEPGIVIRAAGLVRAQITVPMPAGPCAPGVRAHDHGPRSKLPLDRGHLETELAL